MTGFTYACINDHRKIIEILYKNFKSLNLKIHIGKISDQSGTKEDSRNPLSLGRNIFHFACFNGNLSLVKFLIDEFKKDKLEVTAIDNEGRTSFHLACLSGNLSLVKFLLKEFSQYEIGVRAKDKQGRTSFHLACISGYAVIVKFFLKEFNQDEINFHAEDNEGNTGFELACLFGKDSVIVLLHQELELDQVETEFHLACQNGNIKDIVLALLSKKKGINFNEKNNKGQTGLQLAFLTGNISVIEILLKELNKDEIDFNAQDQSGQTIFHLACQTQSWIPAWYRDPLKIQIAPIKEPDCLHLLLW